MAQDFGDETGEMLFRFFMQKADHFFMKSWENIKQGISGGISYLDAQIKLLSAEKDGEYADLAFTAEEYGNDVQAAMIKEATLDAAMQRGLDVRDASADGKLAIRFKTDLATTTGLRESLVTVLETVDRSGERALEARSKIAEREIGLDPIMLTADKVREASQKAAEELAKEAREKGVNPADLDHGTMRIELGNIEGIQAGQGKPAALTVCDVLTASGIKAEATGVDGELAIELPSSSQQTLALTSMSMEGLQRQRGDDLREIAARTPVELLEDPDKVNRTVEDGPVPEGYDTSVRYDPDKTTQLDTPTRKFPVVEDMEQGVQAPAPVLDDGYLAAIDDMAASCAHESDSRAPLDIAAPAVEATALPSEPNVAPEGFTAPAAAKTVTFPAAMTSPQQGPVGEDLPCEHARVEKPEPVTVAPAAEAPVAERAREKEPDAADALTKPAGEPKRGEPATRQEYEWTVQLAKAQLGENTPEYKKLARELGSFEDGRTSQNDLSRIRDKHNLNTDPAAPSNKGINSALYYAQCQQSIEQERRAASRDRDRTHDAPPRGGDAI